MHEGSIAAVIGILALMFILQDKTNQTETFTEENQNVGSTTQTTNCDDVKTFDPKNNDIKLFNYNIDI